jgi:L,D-transpeptidase ErfK/SrfK
MTRHTVREGEILHDLARTYDVGFIELRAANPGVDAWAPQEGQELIIPGAHLLPYDAGHSVVVNVGDMRLYYFGPEPGRVRSWPIGVGREAHETPLGVIDVTELRRNPTWYPTPGQRADSPELPAAVPPGPNNPLGDYAIRVGWDGYNIHGTNKPESVGRLRSRGCIRLYPEDIETLFGLVKVGDTVRIADEPVKFGWIDDELFMEVHASPRQAGEIELGRPAPEEPLEELETYVAYAAGPHLRRVDWGRVRTLVRQRSGVPYQITGSTA